jgi:rhodanese-related sulfurtransferase
MRALLISVASAMALWSGTLSVGWAATTTAAIEEMEGYLEFVEYGGGVIFAEQIPKADWSRIQVIDARDAAQFAKGHIPGAINIEWRQVLARRGVLRKEGMVLLYCNTGSLSAQAGFALRVAGWDNVRILQGGFEEWQAKGGFDAHDRAAARLSR